MVEPIAGRTILYSAARRNHRIQEATPSFPGSCCPDPVFLAAPSGYSVDSLVDTHRRPGAGRPGCHAGAHVNLLVARANLHGRTPLWIAVGTAHRRTASRMYRHTRHKTRPGVFLDRNSGCLVCSACPDRVL
ncbi:hypothetical protein D3C71_1499960 [compost metagenome]